MLTQLRTIFDLIIQFQNAQESFFTAATTELQSRQKLEKAVELRTDEVSVYCFLVENGFTVGLFYSKHFGYIMKDKNSQFFLLINIVVLNLRAKCSRILNRKILPKKSTLSLVYESASHAFI